MRSWVEEWACHAGKQVLRVGGGELKRAMQQARGRDGPPTVRCRHFSGPSYPNRKL